MGRRSDGFLQTTRAGIRNVRKNNALSLKVGVLKLFYAYRVAREVMVAVFLIIGEIFLHN
jgi:hypothetical protein